MTYLNCGRGGREITARASFSSDRALPPPPSPERRRGAAAAQGPSAHREADGFHATADRRSDRGTHGRPLSLEPAESPAARGSQIPTALMRRVVAREVERQHVVAERTEAAGPSTMGRATVAPLQSLDNLAAIDQTRNSLPSVARDGQLGARLASAPAPAPVPFEVGVRPNRRAVHLEPVGELDLATSPTLRTHVAELVDRGFDQVVIDLRGLVFIDLAGVRLLLTLDADARREGWRLSLIPGPRPVRRVFGLTETLDALPFSSAGAAGSGPAQTNPGGNGTRHPVDSSYWVG